MKLIEVNPFSLKANKWNSNKVSRPAFEKLKKSLEKHSSFKPVIVRELNDGTLEILGGFHRSEAAKELGWKTIPVLNLGKKSDEEAKEIGLLDNTRYGEDDKELLDKLISELDQESLEEILPDTEILELPEEDHFLEEAIEEMEKEISPEKDELHKVLKYKFEIDKAEEIEAVLSKVAYENDFKSSDGFADFTTALYYILVIGKE